MRIAGYLVFLGLSIFLHLTRAFPFDDAFIHFRIAENLSNEGLPYFNLNDPVQGSSSPLWIALLAMLISIGISAPEAAGLVNASAAVAMFKLIGTLLNDRAMSSLLRSVIRVMVLLICIPSSFGLMETILAMVLLFGAVAAVPKRPAVSLVLLSLGATCRLELLPLVPLLGFIFWRRGVRSPLVLTLTAAGPLIMYSMAAWHYYGALLPHTILAKAVTYRLSHVESLRHLLVSALAGSMEPPVNVCIVAALLSVCFWGFWKAYTTYGFSDRFVQVLLLLGQPVLCVAIYLSQSVHTFPWYTPLLVPGLVLGASLAGPSLRVDVGAFYGVVIGIRTGIVGAFSLWSVLVAPCRHPYGHEIHKAQRLLELGRSLRQLAISDALLMAPEVGALGWSSSLSIYDTVGLVTSDAIYYQTHRVLSERVAGDLGLVPFNAVVSVQPDWLIGWKRLLPSTDELRLADYEMVAIESKYSCPVPEVRVWRRKQAPYPTQFGEAANR